MDPFNKTITQLLTLPGMEKGGVVLSLAAAAGLTVLLWIAYRMANTRETYQPHFAATLVSLAILSTVLMDLIQSNLALSLGMLGSLSIVRFRTTIKDPRDIGFIFWSMAIGLAAATGCYWIGLAGSLVIGAFLVLSARREPAIDQMMLVIRGSKADLAQISRMVDEECVRWQVKAKNVMADSFELVCEVRLHMDRSDPFIARLFTLEGIDSVNLLAGTKA